MSQNRKKPENEAPPVTLPLLPVKDTVIYPTVYSPLFVGREPSLLAVEKGLQNDKRVFLTAQRDERDDVPKPSGLYQLGCISSIIRVHKLPTGTMKVLVQGVTRAKVLRFVETSPYLSVEVMPLEDRAVDGEELEAARSLMYLIKENLEKMISLGKMVSPDLLISIDDIDSPGKFADLVVSKFGFEVSDLQDVLATLDPIERLNKVNEMILAELDALSSRRELGFPRLDITQGRKDQSLRDQLKAIRNELNDSDPRSEELQDYRKRLMAAKMPKEVRKEAERQLRRLEGMHPEAAEASIVRTYLDHLVELPWMTASTDNLDLQKAKTVLDRDHYGLDKVKERILEFLGVCKLKKKMRGPILCLVGPPGVGKTSLGKSVAAAMGRQFVRCSLGGVKDEAEIRGHRRTYVGAMPGKVIQGIKQAGTNNPVFVLDEIDKLGADFRGDPASALLEVLDPEQNYTFRDHYLNLPFDLSNVFFIATANLIDPIPVALRDRMEIITLPGYTPEEKLEICRHYLVPKQTEENGISDENIRFSSSAMINIADRYTRESGVRDLERKVGSICRKVAKRVADGYDKRTQVNESNLEKFLGPEKFRSEIDPEEVGVGCAIGLAWTSYGGQILLIEVELVKGKGELLVTGSLGDVMKESARAAMTYVRSRAARWGLPENLLSSVDVHIHVPDGATPKDGPSAGVTMATAVVSALTKVPVRSDVAMTGEVTIRGRVLQVGGIKEKILAARRHKVSTVVIPEVNRPDLSEVPEALMRGVTVVTGKTMDDILDMALVGGLKGLRDRPTLDDSAIEQGATA